jgi:hypothetical protein
MVTALGYGEGPVVEDEDHPESIEYTHEGSPFTVSVFVSRTT